MKYTMDQIYEWVKQGQAISPHVMKDVQEYFDVMRSENSRLRTALVRISQCNEVFAESGFQFCKDLAQSTLEGK